MLTGDDIRSAGLIADASPGGYRASSYDVRIGKIITNDGTLHEYYKIPAQGIVQVVSRETMKLPSTISGIATVKRVCATMACWH